MQTLESIHFLCCVVAIFAGENFQTPSKSCARVNIADCAARVLCGNHLKATWLLSLHMSDDLLWNIPLCSIVECAGWREIQNSIYWMGKVGSTCLMEYAFVLFSLSLQSCSFSQLWQCNFEVWSLKFGLFCFEKVGSTCLMEYAFFLLSLLL